jgi:hypothetical protein
VIHLFSESIAGAATIRGFGQEKRFMKRNLYLLDCFARPLFSSLAAIEWLCLRMELLSTFVFAFCMAILVSFPPGTIEPSMYYVSHAVLLCFCHVSLSLVSCSTDMHPFFSWTLELVLASKILSNDRYGWACSHIWT